MRHMIKLLHTRHMLTALVVIVLTLYVIPLKSSLATDNAEHVIVISGSQFSVISDDINTGDIVTWVNEDIIPHTATALDSSWDTGHINSGESKSITINDNTFKNYFCVYHPSMQASLAK